MCRAASQVNKLWYEAKSSVDKKPSGSSNSHFTERDEEGLNALESLPWQHAWALTLMCRLGPEKRKKHFFSSHPSEILILLCANIYIYICRRVFKYFTQCTLCCCWILMTTYTINCCNGYQLKIPLSKVPIVKCYNIQFFVWHKGGLMFFGEGIKSSWFNQLMFNGIISLRFSSHCCPELMQGWGKSTEQTFVTVKLIRLWSHALCAIIYHKILACCSSKIQSLAWLC